MKLDSKVICAVPRGYLDSAIKYDPDWATQEVVMPEYFNDSPISLPTEDRFGIDPFARALANSIRDIKSPVGATIALNGPWGSGKSSAVNLITH